MRVGRILVANKRGFKMLRRGFVFAASIKGQPERDVRRCETGIAFERFGVGIACVAFFALLIKREAFDVALLSALRIFRIGKRSGCRFEIPIVIDRRVSVIFNQRATVFAFENNRKRLLRSAQLQTRRVDLDRIEIDARGAECSTVTLNN